MDFLALWLLNFFLFFFDFTMMPCSLLAQGVDSSILWTMVCSLKVLFVERHLVLIWRSC